MIINCPCGKKKFALDENLIPDKGRLLQCGFCDETWFFDKNINNQSNFIKNQISNSVVYLGCSICNNCLCIHRFSG